MSIIKTFHLIKAAQMGYQKYFIFSAVLILIFIGTAVQYQQADKKLKDADDKIAIDGASDYQNYKLITIKYFNY